MSDQKDALMWLNDREGKHLRAELVVERGLDEQVRPLQVSGLLVHNTRSVHGTESAVLREELRVHLGPGAFLAIIDTPAAIS